MFKCKTYYTDRSKPKIYNLVVQWQMNKINNI